MTHKITKARAEAGTFQKWLPFSDTLTFLHAESNADLIKIKISKSLNVDNKAFFESF